MNPEAADAIKILGATDKIVGVVEDITEKKYLSELQGKEIVGTWKEYDYEKMADIARNRTDSIVPDIIVISYAISPIEASLAVPSSSERGWLLSRT